ncbi:MAG: 50S ribosomal protein L10 [Caldisericia bacterium]|nr:50S ribosomal protein L10 [Caldisericia bacterium]MDD3427414.1 50S ribosomal protein L10 [Caldisericia bacterium]MDD5688845.1 50S ribosomal protein L10 [Caldisericia bacterium]HOW02552.1 50S ribosomal protein L10 [Caldisericia bacterium]HQG82118.1 50S ribosomal protein L10 [Caldisericia bacterium]
MLTRKEKEKLIEEISGLWSNSKGVVFYNFEKMQANEAVEFRKEIKLNNLKAYISKNTLLKKGAKNSGIEISEEQDGIFRGQTGIVYSSEDPLIPCRVIYGFIRKTGKPVIKGGYIDGRFVNSKDVLELAEISSKEAIYQKLAFTLNSPVSKLAVTLNAILSKLVYAINEVKNKKEKNI